MSASDEFYDAVEYVLEQTLKSLKLYEIVNGNVISYNSTTKKAVIKYATSSAEVILYNINSITLVAGDNILIAHQYGAILEQAYIIGKVS